MLWCGDAIKIGIREVQRRRADEDDVRGSVDRVSFSLFTMHINDVDGIDSKNNLFNNKVKAK